MSQTVKEEVKVKKPFNAVQFSVAFFLSLAFGFLIWSLSPIFTGKKQPWDSFDSYYAISLFVAGAVVGFIGTVRQFWIWPVVICAGQILFVLGKIYMESDSDFSKFFPEGILYVVVGSVPAWIGSLAGAVLAFLIKRKEEK